jgi:hypothetical protein
MMDHRQRLDPVLSKRKREQTQYLVGAKFSEPLLARPANLKETWFEWLSEASRLFVLEDCVVLKKILSRDFQGNKPKECNP